MQKPNTPIVFGVILLVAAGLFGLYALTRSEKGDSPPISGTAPTRSGTTSTKSSLRDPAVGSTRDSNPAQGIPQPLATGGAGTEQLREEILEEINDAAVTYDPADLPRIEPYLLHPDKETRQAAMNGMVTLGDASAGALLRNAASRAPTPQEAVRLLEAADYVELPSATLRRRKK
jgi:hypothetical protein